MGSALLERYDDRIAGVLSCYDRVVITGTLPTVCYADGMTKFLNANHIRIFDYPKFAEPLREQVRDRAASLSAAAGIAIEHIGKKHIRKEAVVAKVLERRGDHPGLVHVISAMEGCDAYKAWHDKQTHKTYLRPDSSQCLHDYFYFMDAELGLIHLRVPTWARLAQGSVRRSRMEWQDEGPFRLQFYRTCPRPSLGASSWALVPRDGHSRLARQLTAEGVEFTVADNAFTRRGPRA
jgi:hypothetical protein